MSKVTDNYRKIAVIISMTLIVAFLLNTRESRQGTGELLKNSLPLPPPTEYPTYKKECDQKPFDVTISDAEEVIENRNGDKSFAHLKDTYRIVSKPNKELILIYRNDSLLKKLDSFTFCDYEGGNMDDGDFIDQITITCENNTIAQIEYETQTPSSGDWLVILFLDDQTIEGRTLTLNGPVY